MTEPVERRLHLNDPFVAFVEHSGDHVLGTGRDGVHHHACSKRDAIVLLTGVRLFHRETFEHCFGCPYDELCPADRATAWERKLVDPALRPYHALTAAE